MNAVTAPPRGQVDRAPSLGRPGTWGAAVGLVAALVVVSAASVLLGARWIPPGTLFDPDSPLHGVAAARLDRTLLGLVAGGALGLVGALMQGLTRNPLADPGILGINAGAAFAMVLAISVFGVSDLQGYVWFAFAGAAGAMVLVHAIAAVGRDGATPVKVAIAGAALTAALSSWTSGVLLIDRKTVEAFRLWNVGTVAGRDLDVLMTGLPFIVVGVVLAMASTRSLNALALGDDLARGLGRRLAVDRLVVGVAVVLLAGAATALAGPIAFVGLIVPHGVRAVVGPDYRRVLPHEPGVRRCAGRGRRRGRTAGAAALRGAGRHHDRGHRRAGLPAPHPPRPDRGAVTTVLNRPATATGPGPGHDAPAAVDVVRRARAVPVRRTRIVIASLTVLLVLVFAARTMLGDFTITLVDFFRIIGGTEIPGATYILMESKLPRAVLGVLVGIAFGISGAIFQTTLRNPLASPDIIGVSVGASAAAVFAIVTLGLAWLPGLGRSRARRRAGLGAGPAAGRHGRGQPPGPRGCGPQRRDVLR